MKKNKEMQYYVRKSWEDVESQAGIDYNFFINAKKACDKLDGYKVFNSNGEQVYPEVIKEIPKKKEEVKKVMPVKTINFDLEINDAVKFNNKAVYFIDGRKIPNNLLKETVYILGVNANGYKIAKTQKGEYIGEVPKSCVELISSNNVASIKPYIVRIEHDDIPVYLKADSNSPILDYYKKGNLYVIVNENNGFGKLLKGKGWIELSQVRK